LYNALYSAREAELNRRTQMGINSGAITLGDIGVKFSQLDTWNNYPGLRDLYTTYPRLLRRTGTSNIMQIIGF
jgi:hypothetical protein